MIKKYQMFQNIKYNIMKIIKINLKVISFKYRKIKYLIYFINCFKKKIN